MKKTKRYLLLVPSERLREKKRNTGSKHANEKKI